MKTVRFLFIFLFIHFSLLVLNTLLRKDESYELSRGPKGISERNTQCYEQLIKL